MKLPGEPNNEYIINYHELDGTPNFCNQYKFFVLKYKDIETQPNDCIWVTNLVTDRVLSPSYLFANHYLLVTKEHTRG